MEIQDSLSPPKITNPLIMNVNENSLTEFPKTSNKRMIKTVLKKLSEYNDLNEIRIIIQI